MDASPPVQRGLLGRSFLWVVVLANSAVALSSPIVYGWVVITLLDWISGNTYPGQSGEVVGAAQVFVMVSLGLYLVLGYWRAVLGRLDARSEARLWVLSLSVNLVLALVMLGWGSYLVVFAMWMFLMCAVSAYQWALVSEASLSGSAERLVGRRRGWDARRANRRAQVVDRWGERQGHDA